MPDELVDYITNERTHHVMPEEIDLVENPKEYYKDLKARKDAKGTLSNIPDMFLLHQQYYTHLLD